MGRAICVGLACVAARCAPALAVAGRNRRARSAGARYQAAIAAALPWLAAIGLALERAFAQRFPRLPGKIGGFYTQFEYGVLFPREGLGYLQGEIDDRATAASG